MAGWVVPRYSTPPGTTLPHHPGYYPSPPTGAVHTAGSCRVPTEHAHMTVLESPKEILGV